jgi:hypothetical protein
MIERRPDFPGQIINHPSSTGDTYDPDLPGHVDEAMHVPAADLRHGRAMASRAYACTTVMVWPTSHRRWLGVDGVPVMGMLWA